MNPSFLRWFYHTLLINRCLAFITASMAVRGEKTGAGPVDWSAGVLGIVTGALFLVVVRFV
jgi:hypothetical protein